MRKTNFSCSEPTLNSDFGLKPRSKSATRSSNVNGRSGQSVSVIKPPTGRGREPARLYFLAPTKALEGHLGARCAKLKRGKLRAPQVAQRRLPERERGDRRGVGPQDARTERHWNGLRQAADQRPFARGKPAFRPDQHAPGTAAPTGQRVERR